MNNKFFFNIIFFLNMIFGFQWALSTDIEIEIGNNSYEIKTENLNEDSLLIKMKNTENEVSFESIFNDIEKQNLSSFGKKELKKNHEKIVYNLGMISYGKKVQTKPSFEETVQIFVLAQVLGFNENFLKKIIEEMQLHFFKKGLVIGKKKDVEKLLKKKLEAEKGKSNLFAIAGKSLSALGLGFLGGYASNYIQNKIWFKPAARNLGAGLLTVGSLMMLYEKGVFNKGNPGNSDLIYIGKILNVPTKNKVLFGNLLLPMLNGVIEVMNKKVPKDKQDSFARVFSTQLENINYEQVLFIEKFAHKNILYLSSDENKVFNKLTKSFQKNLKAFSFVTNSYFYYYYILGFGK